MTDLVISALQAATQRAATSPLSSEKTELSVLDLGRDLLGRKEDQTSGLVFGPSAGTFTDNESFITVASAAQSNNAGTATTGNREKATLNKGNKANQKNNLDIFASQQTKAEERLSEIIRDSLKSE